MIVLVRPRGLGNSQQKEEDEVRLTLTTSLDLIIRLKRETDRLHGSRTILNFHPLVLLMSALQATRTTLPLPVRPYNCLQKMQRQVHFRQRSLKNTSPC